MSDLFDLAKPARDTVVPELERIFPADGKPDDRDGLRLGLHFVALLTAFGVNRHQRMNGEIQDPGLSDLIALAFGMAIANAASTFRPVRNGAPVTVTENALEFIGKIAAHAVGQAASMQAGLADVVVPMALGADGRIGAAPFDLNAMLRGKQ